MMNLQTLLSLTLIGFFFAPKPVLDGLPIRCWEVIFSFDEAGFAEHCASACFQTSVMKDAYNDLYVTDAMIERCRLTRLKDRHNFFCLFDKEERSQICWELEKRIALVRQIADLGLRYKYRGREPPEGSDDFEKMELSKLHTRMYRLTFRKEKLYCVKELELLRYHGISASLSDTETDSTGSNISGEIPRGSDCASDSDWEYEIFL